MKDKLSTALAVALLLPALIAVAAVLVVTGDALLSPPRNFGFGLDDE